MADNFLLGDLVMATQYEQMVSVPGQTVFLRNVPQKQVPATLKRKGIKGPVLRCVRLEIKK